MNGGPMRTVILVAVTLAALVTLASWNRPVVADGPEAVAVTNFPEVQQVSGQVVVSQPIPQTRLETKKALVAPAERSNTSDLTDAGTIDTTGFTHVTLSLTGLLQGTPREEAWASCSCPMSRRSRRPCGTMESCSSSSAWKRLSARRRRACSAPSRRRSGSPSRATGCCSTTPRRSPPRQRCTPISAPRSARGVPCRCQGPSGRLSRSAETFPLNGRPFLLSRYPVLARREGFLVQQKGSPVSKYWITAQQKGSPVERKGSPVERKGSPVQRKAFPVEQKGFSVSKYCVTARPKGSLVQQKGSPVQRKGSPVEPERVSRSTRSLPVEPKGWSPVSKISPVLPPPPNPSNPSGHRR